jgi:glucokinase
MTTVDNTTLDAPGSEQSYVLGVDAGGSKVAAALVDRTGRVCYAIQEPMITGGAEASLACIAGAVEAVIAGSGVGRSAIQGVGFGIPGIVDAERGVGVASANLGWRNVPVRQRLNEILGLPCQIEEDVRTAALGEARLGAGRGLDSLFFLVIGTGIAGALVLDGKLLKGADNIAGEIGHAMIEINGPRCKCGAHGCFEALAAGSAIATRARDKLEKGGSLRLAALYSGDLASITAKMVFEAAGQGDPAALEAIEETSAYIAFVLQFIALDVNPRLIVLAGGVPRAGSIFLEPVLRRLEQQAVESVVFSQTYHPGLVQLSALGERVGVLGAATLVPGFLEY